MNKATLSEFIKLGEKFIINALIPLKEKLVIHANVLAEYFNLDRIGLQDSIISRNKYLQRTLLQDSIYNVKSFIVNQDNIDYILKQNEGVLKPINDHGSNNIYLMIIKKCLK